MMSWALKLLPPDMWGLQIVIGTIGILLAICYIPL